MKQINNGKVTCVLQVSGKGREPPQTYARGTCSPGGPARLGAPEVCVALDHEAGSRIGWGVECAGGGRGAWGVVSWDGQGLCGR